MTKSSTECEIVGASDYAPGIVWAGYFMEAQGQPILNAKIHQDNQSVMRMEENGRMSAAGSKSKHIHNRYFWVTDRVKNGEINVKYCPTELMLADFFTKPLQGSLFYRMRDVIMGVKHINSLKDDLPPSAKERVENSMRSARLKLRKEPEAESNPNDTGTTQHLRRRSKAWNETTTTSRKLMIRMSSNAHSI